MNLDKGHLSEEIASGDRYRSLAAIRDQLAAKLDSGQCHTCGGPRGETAGLASIAKELRAVLDAIEALPNANAEVTELDRIRERIHGATRGADAEDRALSGKSAARRPGSRRAGGGRQPGS